MFAPPYDSISDSDLLARMPELVLAERAASAEVIAHLMEIDRRRLYLEQACSSLYRFVIERLGYSEDEALKRVRVARLAMRVPRVLDELRARAIHLTGLFLLSSHLTEQNAEALLSEARGKSRREIEQLLARRFPQPEVEARIEPVAERALVQPALKFAQDGSGPSSATTCSGTGTSWPKIEPRSAQSYRVQFTASAELYAKIERARELLSHALPDGDLPALIERAIDALIESELQRRTGAGKVRKRRVQKAGSRHVPVEVARVVWERDAGQCTFMDAAGRRCSERRFLTLEHQIPYALGGPATAENICLLCANHNAHTARRFFGEEYLRQRRASRERNPDVGTSLEIEREPEPTGRALPAPEPADTSARVLPALCRLGFPRQRAAKVLAELRAREPACEPEPMLRAALAVLVPAPA